MRNSKFKIPPSLLKHLSEVPKDAPVAILLRHSVRNSLPSGKEAYLFPITKVGMSLAQELGAFLGGRLRSIRSSPLHRCVQTGEHLAQGAGIQIQVLKSHLLGDPGPFVNDGAMASTNWESLGHNKVMDSISASEQILPGMADGDFAARFTAKRLLSDISDNYGFHIFVTHDSVIGATVSRLCGENLKQEDWPHFLEAAFIWCDSTKLHVVYRHYRAEILLDTILPFSEKTVLEFGKRLVGMTVGYECKARFFIAGGVFKTLLTGKQPRDVDFWPPSQRARKVLIDCLLQKGATHVKEGMYNDIFTIRDLTVEVAKKCEPETLDARLKRFDIALSAIGVEFTPGGNWDVRIHPLAKTTIKERRILLLKPLVNWKHSLASLERMRRYSQELGYESPTEEENEIWDVFDSQDFEMQRGMISRFKNSTKGNFGVYEQAIRRVECR